MDTKKTKKELQAQYKERKVIGGVYIIKNKETGQLFLASTPDMQGSQNRFEFSQKIGSCVQMKLQKDWAAYGPDAFVFEILEEIKKGDAQTQEEFSEDVKLLKEIYMEKLADSQFY